jgi:hypothetical protein
MAGALVSIEQRNNVDDFARRKLNGNMSRETGSIPGRNAKRQSCREDGPRFERLRDLGW